MLKEDFPDINDWDELHRILRSVPLIENSQDRRNLLKNCRVDKIYIDNLHLDNATTASFVNELTSYLSDKYINNSDPPIWGFINKKPILAKFLENLTVSDLYIQSNDDRAFVINFVERWRGGFGAKLVSYRATYRQLLRIRKKSHSERERLQNKLKEIKQELNLGQQIYQEIESDAQEDERKRKWKKNCGIALLLGLTVLGIYLRHGQTTPTPTPTTPTPTSTTTSTPTSTTTLPPASTTPTPTSTTPTPTSTTTITPIGYTRGWMFIGKITRNSSGDDILKPPTIYPRMIPQSGAIVEVIETTNIRSDQPQAPDFDYAQQEILGCVVPGEKVKILQVEIVPNQAVWARVQKYGDNPTFSPRCPSNGIRALW
ncbi:hypothetical protein AB3R30_06915 [Leptolyngbyaceae cyanobacterium UHCC 1019]